MVKFTMRLTENQRKNNANLTKGIGVKKGKVATDVKKGNILRVAKKNRVEIMKVGMNSDLVKTINVGKKMKMGKIGQVMTGGAEIKKMVTDGNFVKNVEVGNILRVAKKNRGVEIKKLVANSDSMNVLNGAKMGENGKVRKKRKRGEIKEVLTNGNLVKNVGEGNILRVAKKNRGVKIGNTKDKEATIGNSKTVMEELKHKMSNKSIKELLGNPKKRNRNRALFVKLPLDVTDMALLKNLHKDIVKVQKPLHKRYCFLMFKTKAAAEIAMEELQGKQWPGGALVVEKSQKSEPRSKLQKQIPILHKRKQDLSVVDMWDPNPSERHYTILMWSPEPYKRRDHVKILHKDIIAVSRQAKKLYLLHFASLNQAERAFTSIAASQEKVKLKKLYKQLELLVRKLPKCIKLKDVKTAFPGCTSVQFMKKPCKADFSTAIVGFETEAEVKRFPGGTYNILGHEVPVISRRKSSWKDVPLTYQEMKNLAMYIIEVSAFSEETKLKAIKSMFADSVTICNLKRIENQMRAAVLFSSPEQAAAACTNQELHHLGDSRLVVQALNPDLMLTLTKPSVWKKLLAKLEQRASQKKSASQKKRASRKKRTSQKCKSRPVKSPKLTETNERHVPDVDLSPATFKEGIINIDLSPATIKKVGTIEIDLTSPRKASSKKRATVQKSDLKTSPMKSNLQSYVSTPSKEDPPNRKWKALIESRVEKYHKKALGKDCKQPGFKNDVVHSITSMKKKSPLMCESPRKMVQEETQEDDRQIRQAIDFINDEGEGARLLGAELDNDGDEVDHDEDLDDEDDHDDSDNEDDDDDDDEDEEDESDLNDMSREEIENFKKEIKAGKRKKGTEGATPDLKKPKIETIMDTVVDSDEDDEDYEVGAGDKESGEDVDDEVEEDGEDDEKDDEKDDDEDDDDEDEDDVEEKDVDVSPQSKVESKKKEKLDNKKMSIRKQKHNAQKEKQDGKLPKTPTQVNGNQQSGKKNKRGESPKSKSPMKKHLEGGVIIEEMTLGNGPLAKRGKQITVHYVGRLMQNNKQFDATTQGPGFKFRLGRGEVIRGWDIGVAGMKVGGKRKIICPAAMGYGAKGSPPVIPSNSTLMFEVELKGVN